MISPKLNTLKVLESMKESVNVSTVDVTAAIAQVIKDHLTPQQW